MAHKKESLFVNDPLPKKQTKKSNGKPVRDIALNAVDWIAKLAAGVFFVATSYGYVSSWLKAHQTNPQIPIAGGILVVSVALYLYCRKR